jgi:hypothetical protein
MRTKKRANRRYSSAIKVVARFRPPNALELQQGSEVVVNIESEDTLTIDMRSVPPPPVATPRQPALLLFFVCVGGVGIGG